jgi:DNA-damage-inducible protein D
MTNKSPDFETIRHVDETEREYWYARELAPLLGYDKWQNFETVIKRGTIACQQVQQEPKYHFVSVNKMIQLGRGAQRQVKDYELSRFACYLIAQNGDPRKTEIAAAQAYFAYTAREMELFKLYEEQQDRLALREQVEENNQALKQAAFRAGVLPKSYKTFENAGYEGLYNGLNKEEIKTKKGIEPREEILDRMGRMELAANAFRITQTEGKLTDQNIVGQNNAIETHREVGEKVRYAIKDIGGTMPEELPAEPSIKPLITGKRRNRRLLKENKELKEAPAEYDPRTD